jgi:hypothetical protein
LTVYAGLPAVSVPYASPMPLGALQWAQSHHMDDRDWISETTAPSESQTTGSMVGDVLRIRATAMLPNRVAATSVWVGILTGEQRKPMLTMRWGHTENKRT